MKKKLILFLCIMLLMTTFPISASATSVVLSPQSVYVNGVKQSFEVYNIEGSNYFKLRDIAYMLNGSKAQFSVEWDSTKNAILIIKGVAYNSVGNEMVIGNDKSSTAKPSNQHLMVDGVEVSLSAYNIGGNNFLKLRDLGNTLNFLVDYDSATNSVIISTQDISASNIDMEVLRAINCGFVPKKIQGDWQKAITYKQFCTMLGNMITITDPSLTDKWETLTSNLPDEVISRQEAMLASLLAGQLMGLMEAQNYDEEQTLASVDINMMSSKLFPGCNQPVTISTDGNGRWDNYIIAAVFYGMRQVSLFSNTSLFTLHDNNLELEKALTREQAIQAVARLYESNRTTVKGVERAYKKQLDTYIENLKSVPELRSIFSAADQRREAILNSKTDIYKSDTLILGQTYTGKAYYVSNGGNDNANGLTPQTAWATLEKVNDAKLNYGDAVFFERGGLWRGLLQCKDNVTYSAYGEGSKPKIYGSPENGADSSKWSLVEGTNNIWVFYKEMYDTGGIVFNGGEDFATRMVGIWDGNKYVDIVDQSTPIDIKKLNNLKIFSAVDYTGYSSQEARYELVKKGKLYLRCDAGNPGKVYKSIEFQCLENNNGSEFAVAGSDGVVIDNLCVKYTSGTGISIGSNSSVQNCEVAWAGGAVMNFYSFDTPCLLRVGDGITMGRSPNSAGINNSVINNYIHNMYDQAIASEMGPGWNEDLRYTENTIIRGNLTEYTSGGIIVADWSALNEGWGGNLLFKNIAIEDNYVMYSGYGQGHLTLDFDWGTAGPTNNGNTNVMFGFPGQAGKDIYVKNNVFFISRYALVSGKNNDQVQKYDVTFSGNTYVQNEDNILAEWTSPDNSQVTNDYLCDRNAKQTIADVLGDDASKVIVIK